MSKLHWLFSLFTAVALLLTPFSVQAQGTSPSPNDPFVVIANTKNGTDPNSIQIRNVLPSPSVVKSISGANEAQPFAVSVNNPIPGTLVVQNQSDVLLNVNSMKNTGIVTFDVSKQLQQIAKNEAIDYALTTQNAKMYLPTNTDVTQTNAVTTVQPGLMTFQTYQTSDGKTVFVPDAYTAKLIQATGLNPIVAHADYAFVNGDAAASATAGKLEKYGFKSDLAVKASGGDPNAVTKYLYELEAQGAAANAAAAARAKAEQPLFRFFIYGDGPLKASVEAYLNTFYFELNQTGNLRYATLAANQSARYVYDYYVEIENQKAYDAAFQYGQSHAKLNTVMGMSAGGDYSTIDIDPLFWSDLYLQMKAQGNDVGQTSMVFVFDKCPTPEVCANLKKPNPGSGGISASDVGNRDAKFAAIAFASGIQLKDLGDMCAAREFGISQDDPAKAVQAFKLAPNFPVVIGQDPTQRGVDLFVRQVIPPVIVSYNYTYSERINERENPNVADRAKNPTVWDGEFKECRRDSFALPDTIASLSVHADLSSDSVSWITSGELQQKYPGIQVYQTHWNLYPGMGNVSFTDGGRGFTGQWNRLPLRDPGVYIVTVEGVTTGTEYSPPRAFRFNEPIFNVAVLLVALIR